MTSLDEPLMNQTHDREKNPKYPNNLSHVNMSYVHFFHEEKTSSIQYSPTKVAISVHTQSHLKQPP